MRVVNSRFYQVESRLFHRLLDGLGIERPKKVHLYEILQCKKCGEEIPHVGIYCPLCGSMAEEEKD